MRLDVTGRPQALHAGWRHPGGARHRAATPPPQMRRWRHRLIEHLLDRGRRQPRLAPAPGPIAQPGQPAQRKAPHPAVHRKPRYPHLLGDALLGQTLRTQQDDLRSPTVAHRYRRRAHPAAQFLSLLRTQLNPLTSHGLSPSGPPTVSSAPRNMKLYIRDATLELIL